MDTVMQPVWCPCKTLAASHAHILLEPYPNHFVIPAAPEISIHTLPRYSGGTPLRTIFFSLLPDGSGLP